IILANQLVTGLTPELPGDLAPESADHGPVGLVVQSSGGDLGPHENRSPHVAGDRNRALLEQLFDSRQGAGGRGREEMIEGQLRVGLAAAEIGLELDDWIAARSGHAKEGLGEQSAEALGEEGSAEELGGVLVF